MIKQYLMTTCVSYTFVLLVQTLIFHFNHQSMNNDLVLRVFVVCLVVNVLVNITINLEISEWLTNVLSIIEIAGVVCLSNYLGGYTNMLIDFENFLAIIVVSILVYYFVKAVVYVKNSEDAKKINEKIRKKHRRN